MQLGKIARRMVVAMALLAGNSSFAAYTVYLYQSGADVVATGSGTLNLNGLTSWTLGSPSNSPRLTPNSPLAIIGPSAPIDIYTGITGSPSFGPNSSTALASSATGNTVGWSQPSSELAVPAGYVSGSPLSSSATWNATTLAALGVTPGTYKWTWAGDSLTLHVNVQPPNAATSIPTLSEWGLIGLSSLMAMFGLIRMRRRNT